MTEQRYVLAIAYRAGPSDSIIKGVDGRRDFFTPEELEKAAWAFLKSGRQMGLFHADGTVGAAEVCESYIYRGPNWALPDGTVVNQGDWLIGSILDERSWGLAKSGRIDGLSPQGVAKRRKAS